MHFSKRYSRNLGFSLIELLVAITILLLVTGGALAGFLGFRDRRSVEEATLQVRQLMVSAQQKASVKETPSGCINHANNNDSNQTNDVVLRAYRVSISGSTVSLTALCLLETATPAASGFPTSAPAGAVYTVIDSVTLPSGVSISSSPSTSKIEFYTLEQGTTPGATFTLTSSVGYRFTVNTGGTITSVTKVP